MSIGRLFLKALLTAMIVLFAWVAVRAVLPDSRSVAPTADDSPPVTLSEEDLALLEDGSPTTYEAPAPDQSKPDAEGTPDAVDKPDAATEEPAQRVSSPASPKEPPATTTATPPGEHNPHAEKSQQQPPVVKRRTIDPKQPLPADGAGRVRVEWDVLASTKVDEDFKPTFLKNLREAHGKTISMSGFMSPLDEAGKVSVFLLLEFPLGCFYCQTPDPTGIVVVELAEGRQVPVSYNLVRVTGKLTLNSDDPEDFLYIISDAELSQAD